MSELEAALILFSWVFAAGAFWASTRAMRREMDDLRKRWREEVEGLRRDLNGMGQKIESNGRRWREVLAVMLASATTAAQREQIIQLLRSDE